MSDSRVAVALPQVRALAIAWNALINELRARRVLVDGQTPPDAVVAVHEAVRALMDLAGVEPVYAERPS